MKVLFTKSNKIGSRLIRAVTGEDISHCAITVLEDTHVLHSSTSGVTLLPIEEFISTNDVVRQIELPSLMTSEEDEIYNDINIINKYLGKPYDYMAFIYLGIRLSLRFLGISTPKVNLFNISGMFICTELVDEVVDIGEYNKELLTPGQLYDILEKKYTSAGE